LLDRVCAVLPIRVSRAHHGTPEVGRRSVLVAGLLLGTAACTPYKLGQDQRPTAQQPEPDEPGRTDPDVALAATVLAAEQSLLHQIDATVAAHPRLDDVLAAARKGHAAHVALLAEAVPDQPASGQPTPGQPTPGPASGAPAPSGTSPVRVPVPRDARRALGRIVRAEDVLGRENRTRAFAAESGAFARILASMAAAAAQQSVTLAEARTGRASR
jgi:hypothetical protein